jgi:hypothetical protein
MVTEHAAPCVLLALAAALAATRAAVQTLVSWPLRTGQCTHVGGGPCACATAAQAARMAAAIRRQAIVLQQKNADSPRCQYLIAPVAQFNNFGGIVICTTPMQVMPLQRQRRTRNNEESISANGRVIANIRLVTPCQRGTPKGDMRHNRAILAGKGSVRDHNGLY